MQNDIARSEHSVAPAPSPTSFVTVQQGAFRTDTVCSRALLRVMVGDYLLYIYPLIPVVHRPSFCLALNEDRDNYDDDFLGLLIALCAIVVALLPSKYESYRRLDLSMALSRAVMLDRCHGFLIALRTPDFFEKIGFSKWAASYLMAIAFFQVGKPNHARMIEVESMQLGRLLELHRVDR